MSRYVYTAADYMYTVLGEWERTGNERRVKNGACSHHFMFLVCVTYTGLPKK